MEKDISEVYDEYSLSYEWTDSLVKASQDVGIDLMTTPYNVEAIGKLDAYVKSFKIGSGDIT